VTLVSKVINRSTFYELIGIVLIIILESVLSALACPEIGAKGLPWRFCNGTILSRFEWMIILYVVFNDIMRGF
jgi:hypothetical protein